MSSSEEDVSLEGTPKVGEVFADKYRIDRVLGVGGMGVVLAATHVHLREKVAIKVLLPMHSSRQETVARFLREGRAAVKIRSEHVGRVIDVGTHAGLHYIVMEYLEGSDLAELLKRQGRIPPPFAVDYVLQACEAIAEAHAMHTVHRDLKPANLFLVHGAGGAPCIKVLDFGISKMTMGDGAPEELAMTRTSSILGSPLYMSPEQLRSSKTVDERADIWAIGIMLYELIAGVPPFEAETVAVLGALVLSGHVPDVRERVPETPAGLALAIETCLRSDVMERFPSLAELAIALEPFGTPAARTSVQRICTVLQNVPRPPSSFSGVRPRASSSVELAAFAKLSTSSSNPSLPTQPSNWGSTTNPFGSRRRSSAALYAVAGAAGVVVLFAGIFGVTRLMNGPTKPTDTASAATNATASVAPPTTRASETTTQAAASVTEPPATAANTTARSQVPTRPSAKVGATTARSAAPVTTTAPVQSTKTTTGFAKDRYD